ncbi:LuxR C-terminal-related transcriptional regulator [Kitasatospora cineracea]
MLEALGLTDRAGRVYRTLLDRPAADLDEIAAHCALSTVQVHDCLDELGHLMLVRASAEHPGRMCAIDPAVGLADLLARQEVELAERQATLAASRAAVTRLVADRAEHRAAHGERLLGIDAVQHRLEQMARATQREVLSSQPGNQNPVDLDASRGPDAAALARGIAMRSLYQDSTRHQLHTVNYAHWLHSQGGEVRTSPTVPQRIVLIDRREALVPIDPDDNRKGALHVTEPGLLQPLIDLFDQAWNTAVPLGSTAPDDPATGLTATEREILRLLGSGLTDEATGQRLGVSARTVGRHMASVMERLNATSRFEAGIKAAQHGWL